MYNVNILRTKKKYYEIQDFCGEKDQHFAACYKKNSVNILVD